MIRVKSKRFGNKPEVSLGISYFTREQIICSNLMTITGNTSQMTSGQLVGRCGYGLPFRQHVADVFCGESRRLELRAKKALCDRFPGE